MTTEGMRWGKWVLQLGPMDTLELQSRMQALVVWRKHSPLADMEPLQSDMGADQAWDRKRVALSGQRMKAVTSPRK